MVDAARDGDSDAIEALVRRYQSRIFNFTRALTANDADAEDLTQETFIRAFRAIGRFRGDSSFKSWLYQIATNAARTHFGKRTRQAAVWERRVEADDVADRHLASRSGSVEESVMQRDALAGISILPAPDGTFIHPRAADPTKLSSSHNRPAPEAVTSAPADVQPTGAPYFQGIPQTPLHTCGLSSPGGLRSTRRASACRDR